MYALPPLEEVYKTNQDRVDPSARDFVPFVQSPEDALHKKQAAEDALHKKQTAEDALHKKQSVETAFCVRHIFQNKYLNIKVYLSGLGDFIRGTCALYNLCKHNGWHLEVCWHNYPELAKYLHACDTPHENIPINSFLFIPWNAGHTTVKDYIQHDIKQGKPSSNLSTNLFPLNHTLLPEFQPYMQNILRLSDDLQKQYDSMTRGIIPGKYVVLHLRTANMYENKSEYPRMINELNRLKMPAADTYVFCQDLTFRKQLVDTFGFKTLNTKVTSHLGIDSNEDGIRETLIEFHFMGKAKAIHQVSAKSYGSCFSEWCAKVYNIPLYHHRA